MALSKDQKEAIISEYATHEGDTGSPEVQVALLTQRITELTKSERGERVAVGSVGTLEQILFGPSRTADGTTNLVGALRRAMATTGYTDPKEFQRVEVIVAPHQRS